MKHIIHNISFVLFLLLFQYISSGFRIENLNTYSTDPIKQYGYTLTFVLYLLRIACLLALPQCIFNMVGLLFYNGFSDKVKLKSSSLLAPFICIRVVTRGDYPDLVRMNVQRNIQTLKNVGMKQFLVEVVTDNSLNLPKSHLIRELVVPREYCTKSGALFKARALQYCLEDEVNKLSNEDWIVHLDEETLLTEDSVCGIINFCMDGQHQFGQGLITYANEHIVNWVTTLADTYRVAEDLGKLRFQLAFFHRPIFSWKGSFMVAKVEVERKVSFDHGLDGSIAEDCYFGMIAYSDGFSFNFIEGEMWEKSTFSMWDYLQQRKRWAQGIYLVVHSSKILFRFKVFVAMSFYAWVLQPFTTLNILLVWLFPLPTPVFCDILFTIMGAVNLWMYIFGVVRSFSQRLNSWQITICIVGALCTIPITICIEIVAVIWGILSAKQQFYVVQKEANYYPIPTRTKSLIKHL